MGILAISTDRGTVFVPEEQNVVCKIGGNGAVVKHAKDLQEGERVIYEYEWIKADIDVVHDVLMERDPIYKQAHDYLHREAEDKEVTYLSFYLNDAFKERGIEEGTERIGIIQKLMEKYNNEHNLNPPNRLISFLERIAKKQRTLPLSYNDETIGAWINGPTLKPERDEALEVLSEFHQGLREFYESYAAHNDAYWFYHIYTIMRREVMSYLSKHGGKAEKKSKPAERDLIKSEVTDVVSRGIDITLEALKDDIKGGIIPATVTSIKPVKSEREKKEGTRAYEKKLSLHRGLATVKDEIELEKYSLKAKSPGDLITEYTFLERGLFDAVEYVLRAESDVTGLKGMGSLTAVALLAKEKMPLDMQRSYAWCMRAWKNVVWRGKEKELEKGEIDENTFENERYTINLFIKEKPWEVSDGLKTHEVYSELKELISLLAQMSHSLPKEFVAYRYNTTAGMYTVEKALRKRPQEHADKETPGMRKIYDREMLNARDPYSMAGMIDPTAHDIAKVERGRSKSAEHMMKKRYGSDIFYEIDFGCQEPESSSSVLSSCLEIYGFKKLAELVKVGESYLAPPKVQNEPRQSI